MKNKGLQKFTTLEEKINKILSLDIIQIEDIKELTDPEKDQLFAIITETLNSLKGEERDKLIKKIDPVISKSSKNEIWESNHNNITWAISTLMQEYGRMPTKTEIANKTGLSRQTIHKHIKEYYNHPEYLVQVEQFKFMTAKVLTKVFHFAVNGDIAAAKLYFNVIGNINESQASKNTFIQNRNNYIQINGTVISQEVLKQLEPEQLNSIEAILKNALPKSQD